MVTVGSSPLARGLPARGEAEKAQTGIIPARAGFTHRIEEKTNGPQDHPRSRGVYRMRESIVLPFGGSSPLARGLRQ